MAMHRKIQYFLIVIVIFVFFMIGCESELTTNQSSEDSMTNYYTKEYFDSIIIGKSTYWDLYDVAVPELVQSASFGAICKYPMQNGGYVQIYIYGKDMVVGAIKEVY